MATPDRDTVYTTDGANRTTYTRESSATGWFVGIIVALALLASLGPALWASAIVVKYRDFRFVIPFVLQFGLYLSPVGFQTTIVPERWRLLYSLNPMVGIIDGWRSSQPAARRRAIGADQW